MNTAFVATRAGAGLDAPPVRVEIHLSAGLPAFNVVGLPESTVKEARERVRSALLNCHFEWPDYRITVNLAPAELPKAGGRFDLPIAIALLVASEQLPTSAIKDREFYGELGLDGALQPCRGLLSAVQAGTLDCKTCVVPSAQVSTLCTVPDSRVIAADDLLSLCGMLKMPEISVAQPAVTEVEESPESCLSQVHGQLQAKRALEIAACGGHHLLFTGPPGAGKTLLASRLPGILPEPQEHTMLSLRLIHDLLGLPTPRRRPFRAPHHSATQASLIGGGPMATPGEVSLAHGGVLFLDELPEFPRHVLDSLRQPLEEGEVQVSRAKASHRYPAMLQLIAAMNPCPCGYAGVKDMNCRCSPDVIARYQNKVSGPLLDRIDLHVPLARQDASTLWRPTEQNETSTVVRARVTAVQKRQLDRQNQLNAQLNAEQIIEYSSLDRDTRGWFEDACDRLKLSARAIHRCLRVARTIADMSAQERVEQAQLLEAMGYRPSNNG